MSIANNVRTLQTAFSNIPALIEMLLDENLHVNNSHPIAIIKNKIYAYFKQTSYNYEYFDDLSPIVTVEDNFDKLLIPSNHVSRRKTDTYYINEKQVLRTHTSAHQNELLGKGYQSFIVTGPVFRKDEVDCNHYPVFHQMEMLTVVNSDPISELKGLISGLIEYLFPQAEYRFGTTTSRLLSHLSKLKLNFKINGLKFWAAEL